MNFAPTILHSNENRQICNFTIDLNSNNFRFNRFDHKSQLNIENDVQD